MARKESLMTLARMAYHGKNYTEAMRLKAEKEEEKKRKKKIKRGDYTTPRTEKALGDFGGTRSAGISDEEMKKFMPE